MASPSPATAPTSSSGGASTSLGGGGAISSIGDAARARGGGRPRRSSAPGSRYGATETLAHALRLRSLSSLRAGCHSLRVHPLATILAQVEVSNDRYCSRSCTDGRPRHAGGRCAAVRSASSVWCSEASPAVRAWLGRECARWLVLSERLPSASRAAGAARLLSRRSRLWRGSISCPMRRWRRRRYPRRTMLSDRNGAAPIPRGAAVSSRLLGALRAILRRAPNDGGQYQRDRPSGLKPHSSSEKSELAAQPANVDAGWAEAAQPVPCAVKPTGSPSQDRVRSRTALERP